MTVRQKVFIAAAILFLFFAPFALDTEAIVVPGWHITPSERNSLYHYLIPFWFLLISIIYRKVRKSHKKVSTTFFVTHLLISVIPLIIVYFFPLTIFFSGSFEPEAVIDSLANVQKLWYLFMVGQVVCTPYLLFKLFKTQKQKNSTGQTSS